MASPDVVDTPEEAAELELPPLIVREPLEAFLDEQGLGEGRVEAERIGEGHSNVTYLVTRGDERFVLRRPPRPPLPPSAHDVLREARLLRAIEGTPTCARPRCSPTCDDEAVIGVPFYVMEEMHGRRDHQRRSRTALDTRRSGARICEELVDALVEMHAVDWRACGLEGFGKPTGYLERQLRRFNGLWEHNKTRELPLVAGGGRVARRQPARVARRRRSCTATTGSATRWSPTTRRPAWSRSSTGRWRRSATRWPTSAT